MLTDLAHSLELDEDKVKEYFVYLEELELVSIVCENPF